ncbi:GNAT family N-acetyltransferase [Streptomyces sp. NPDC003042]
MPDGAGTGTEPAGGGWSAAEYEGHGYATEAVRVVLADLFQRRGAHRVSAECDARNLRSAALPRRVGFTREGRRQATWGKGAWTDDLLFGLLVSDRPGAAPAPVACRPLHGGKTPGYPPSRGPSAEFTHWLRVRHSSLAINTVRQVTLGCPRNPPSPQETRCVRPHAVVPPSPPPPR